MKSFPEKRLWKRYSFIAGVDEAGRGPLAGPVVASAVILPRDFYNPEIDDSKVLSPQKRERLFRLIRKYAISFSFGIVDSRIIDEINILEATKRAMSQAISSLNPPPEIVLIDALSLKDIKIKQMSIIRGDRVSISIAAASILAKVKRDIIMCEYHKKYPVYQFDRHKGYPTRLHRQRLRKFGPCPIHRKTFRLL